MTTKLGTPAIPFDLRDIDGNMHRLQDDSGHWLLMILHRHLG